MSGRSNARQVGLTCGRSVAAGVRSRSGGPAASRCPITCLGPRLLLLGLARGDRVFEILQRQVELVGIELFRAFAASRALELADQVAQPIVLSGELMAHIERKNQQARNRTCERRRSRRNRSSRAPQLSAIVLVRKNLVKVYHFGIASPPKISESDTFRQIRMLIQIDDDVFGGI
jgi:hypothetical protein